MQVLNQAEAQPIRNECIDSCNEVVDEACAKFVNTKLQVRRLHASAKANIHGAGREFDSITSTMAVAMREVESAVATMPLHMSAWEAYVTDDQLVVGTEIRAIMQRASTLEATVAGGSGASGCASVPSGTLSWGYLPETDTMPKMFEGGLDQSRAGRDDVADFLDTRNVGMFKFLKATSMNREDSTMKWKWIVLG